MKQFDLTSLDGTALQGRHWPATGPRATLALVHGFGEHSGRYEDMATYLSDNGVEVIAIDLRGYGESEGKRGVIQSYDDYRSDLQALLDYAKAQSPKTPLFLYGHSMGGGLILDHGLSKDITPIVGFIASGPLLEPTEAIPDWQRKAVTISSRIFSKRSMKNEIESYKISTFPDEQERYENDPLNHNRMGLRTAVEIIETGERTLDRALEWKHPLLLMHARGDQLTHFAASEQFAALANTKDSTPVQFMPLEGVMHEIHNDMSRSRVYRAILDFIGELS